MHFPYLIVLTKHVCVGISVAWQRGEVNDVREREGLVAGTASLRRWEGVEATGRMEEEALDRSLDS